jgi:hypothetical protein
MYHRVVGILNQSSSAGSSDFVGMYELFSFEKISNITYITVFVMCHHLFTLSSIVICARKFRLTLHYNIWFQKLFPFVYFSFVYSTYRVYVCLGRHKYTQPHTQRYSGLYPFSVHVPVPGQDSTVPFGREEFRLSWFERPVWPIEFKALWKYIVVQLLDVIRIAASLTYLTAYFNLSVLTLSSPVMPCGVILFICP